MPAPIHSRRWRGRRHLDNPTTEVVSPGPVCLANPPQFEEEIVVESPWLNLFDVQGTMVLPQGSSLELLHQGFPLLAFLQLP
jgi:hypothetical protein